jgi:hypothetical protein
MMRRTPGFVKPGVTCALAIAEPTLPPLDTQNMAGLSSAQPALTGQAPSLISRANLSADPAKFGFLWRISGAVSALSQGSGATFRRNKREADLSTEQTGTQAPSRLPRAYGHQGRTQSALGTARTRPQTAFRLTADNLKPRRLLSWND